MVGVYCRGRLLESIYLDAGKTAADLRHTLEHSYQHEPFAEAKLVSCIRGQVWDVAVDLRAGSPTFLQWCAHELSAENQKAMFIPPGCAHGFQTL
ncbi:dTDP-4-keto-6-deoxy-D-glucose epimerase, partial [bacterium]|nr:dTDP-4-keto-6-deoxy-D-glucose epimerase [bacterium]